VVKFHHRVVWPEPLLDLSPRYHLAMTLHEHPDNLKGLLLEQNLLPTFVQFTGPEVEFKGSETCPIW